MRKLKTKLWAASVAAGLGFSVAAGSLVAAGQVSPQAPAANAGTVKALATTACKRQSAANAAGQDIVLSTGEPRTYTGIDWQIVDCTSTTFRLRFGERAIVVSDFNAEADCNGSDVNNGQWCQTKAILNGAEGAPWALEPSSFAFDGVAGGVNNWQAHSMKRAWEVRCGVQDGCQYKFAVQTRMHDGSVTGLWLDEVAVHLRVTVGNAAPL